MDQDGASLVLNVIAACGCLVWLAAWVFQRRTAKSDERDADIEGEVVVQGNPRELAERTCAVLVKGLPGTPLQQAAILEQGSDLVRWKSATPTLSHEGELRFLPQGGGQSRATYALRRPARRGLTFWARAVHVLGLVVLVGLYLLLDRFVASNPDPSVRWQTFQMLQCIHLLWPPFLLAGIDRGIGRGLGKTVETMVRNLPFQKSA